MLGVEGEHCTEAAAAVERVTRESFQIVILDWDQQSEARALLTTARERKASERPLTLAMVSDDASVPQALQAGANSILRKPLLLNQVRRYSDHSARSAACPSGIRVSSACLGRSRIVGSTGTSPFHCGVEGREDFARRRISSVHHSGSRSTI